MMEELTTGYVYRKLSSKLQFFIQIIVNKKQMKKKPFEKDHICGIENTLGGPSSQGRRGKGAGLLHANRPACNSCPSDII